MLFRQTQGVPAQTQGVPATERWERLLARVVCIKMFGDEWTCPIKNANFISYMFTQRNVSAYFTGYYILTLDTCTLSTLIKHCSSHFSNGYQQRVCIILSRLELTFLKTWNLNHISHVEGNPNLKHVSCHFSQHKARKASNGGIKRRIRTLRECPSSQNGMCW